MNPSYPPVSRFEFCRDTAPYSIAIDGFVRGEPWFDPRGPHANFNHHEDVDRLATRATCAQVHLAIRQGLFSRFRDGGEPTAQVYANDSDQDVCLSWYLLKNHFRAAPTMNAALNRLVGLEDMLDATAGAYPYPVDLPLLGEVAWVFEPYTRARAGGSLDGRDPAVFAGIVEDVYGRIDRHLLGTGGRMKLETSYERAPYDCGPGIVMVREGGAHARTAMFSDGIRAFVSVRDRKEGGHVYVLGRMSQYVSFNLPKTYTALNVAEGNGLLLTTNGGDRWGGSDTIGGSPRVAGSKLSPDDVAEVIRSVVHEETEEES